MWFGEGTCKLLVNADFAFNNHALILEKIDEFLLVFGEQIHENFGID